MAKTGTDLIGQSDDLADLPSVIEFLRQFKADYDAHNHDGFNSKSFDNLIVRALIASGLLVGSSIYIPNLLSPLFSVDSAGNVKVASLNRSDFHWFTVFESIDGYDKNGVPVLNIDNVYLPTTNSSGNKCAIQKLALYQNNFTWDKRRKVTMGINFDTVGTAGVQLIYLGSGVQQDSFPNLNKCGFATINNNLYGMTANGSANTQLLLQAFTTNFNYDLMVDFVPTIGGIPGYADFYVNGVKKGRITTTLPTSINYANYLLSAEVQTVTTAIKGIRISYWDFWQAN